ncbi:MAG: PHP domain-containing protein [Deltaproteobacteria bacterium]|nr:PHP domain-containing protein [Deltaproteobacteria bacterium]
MLKLYDYTGIIHFHSEYSYDGRASIAEIVKAAGENSIDFLMLTDHSTLEAKKRGLEGWHGDVLLIVGEEIAPRFNHYLAFGIDRPTIVGNDDEVNPQVYINAVREQGGIGFISHPDHQGTEMFHVKHFPWQDWTVSGYAGIGIWDFMTDWQFYLRGYLSGLIGFLFPAYVLKGPKKVTLERWDSLNQNSRVVGIGELDNHDSFKKVLGMGFSVFPFSKAFKFVRTHLLTEAPLVRDNGKDQKMLLTALERGRAYAALEYFCEAKGFLFMIADKARQATMGDEFFLDGKALLRVEVPERSRICVIRDGVPFGETVGKIKEYEIRKKGVYRIEVFLKHFGKYRPWIFSNPVYVR